MKLKKFICSIVLINSIILVNAQNHLNTFLSDLSIKEFNLGSKLIDIKKNQKISNDITELKYDSITSACSLEHQKINFFDIEEIDEIILNFKNNSLKSVVFEILDNPIGPEFEKTLSLFESRYGNPTVKNSKDTSSKIYTWKDGENKLMLKQLKISFLIKYYD
jgi:hypothetical protein